MLVLIPDWAHHYDEFWRAIRDRNLWFIRLRYFAVFILLLFIFIGEQFLEFNLTAVQIKSILIISFAIIVYNVILNSTRQKIGDDPKKFNCLHISLIQMILDLISLMLLVYYTGNLDSPLSMLFVFHMIIGSMILPGYLVYSIACVVSVSYSLLFLLQSKNIIPHHIIAGIISEPNSHSTAYEIIFVIGFTFVLFVIVYIANGISRQLYQREQQLREALEKLKESERAKQKYTIGVVHEIKTPLSAIKSILDIVISKYVGAISLPVEQKLIRAQMRSDEALNLINDVLRLSKLKLLEIMTPEVIEIEKTFNKIIDIHNEQAKSKKININFVNKLSSANILKGDLILLELALSNCITNALKYVGINGNIEIVLEETANKIIIQISDDGIGIPKLEQKKIFEQFYRASNVDRISIEGTGMGLAIVKEIIEKMNGSIEIESPSKLAKENFPGTSVIIKLPYETSK